MNKWYHKKVVFTIMKVIRLLSFYLIYIGCNINIHLYFITCASKIKNQNYDVEHMYAQVAPKLRCILDLIEHMHYVLFWRNVNLTENKNEVILSRRKANFHSFIYYNQRIYVNVEYVIYCVQNACYSLARSMQLHIIRSPRCNVYARLHNLYVGKDFEKN